LTPARIESRLKTVEQAFQACVKGIKGWWALAPEASMKDWKSIGMLLIALAGLMLLFMPLPASAQSCALCYTQAASSGARMIQALKSGILILIAPPTLMTVGVIFVCYHKRNQTREDHPEHSQDNSW
jgi:hypothetical protein